MRVLYFLFLTLSFANAASPGLPPECEDLAAAIQKADFVVLGRPKKIEFRTIDKNREMTSKEKKELREVSDTKHPKHDPFAEELLRKDVKVGIYYGCLLYTSPSPRDRG